MRGQVKVHIDSDMQIVRVEYRLDGKVIARAESYSPRVLGGDKDVTSRQRITLATAMCTVKCVEAMVTSRNGEEW